MSVDSELNYRLYVHRESDFERTPYQEELSKYAAIASGNAEESVKKFHEDRDHFEDGKGILSTNPLRNVIYHFIVAVSLISRFCIEGGLNMDTSYTLADIYIRKVDKATDREKVLDLFEEMLLDYGNRMKNIKKENVMSLHIRKCIDYIYDHLHEKLTVKVLADYLGLNPTYLSKLFVKETNQNIGDFITHAKIDTAKNMLEYSDFSCLEISMSLGFSSQSHFISVFKKVTGETPKTYRAKHYNSLKK